MRFASTAWIYGLEGLANKSQEKQKQVLCPDQGNEDPK